MGYTAEFEVGYNVRAGCKGRIRGRDTRVGCEARCEAGCEGVSFLDSNVRLQLERERCEGEGEVRGMQGLVGLRGLSGHLAVANLRICDAV